MERPLWVGAAAAAIRAPVPLAPVNDTTATSGWRTSASPATSPLPWTRLKTPGGSSASANTSAHRSADSGVDSAGLRTTVQPAASAGASFQLSIMKGVFQGVMSAATPAGRRCT